MLTSKDATGLAQGLASVLSQRRLYAVFSAAALVLIQVGIGIVLKAAQTDNHYEFSPSSSVTISEFVKMLMAIGFFYREWARRVAENAGRAYLPVSASDDSVPLTFEMDGQLDESVKQSEMGDETLQKTERWVERSFLAAVRKEVSTDIAFGLALLSLFYVLINNLIFVSYQVADPATISLTKSGVTCVTALVLKFTLNTKITSIQWLAIVLQVCGLLVTQYDPTAGGVYSIGVYLLLIFQVFLSAVSGVVNQGLLQASSASLHASNIILYGSGAWSNLLCHVLMRTIKPDEPGFFEGYDSLHAILIILNNVLIGLAINAVYKYANAIVKCLATAIATAILLFLSPIFFGTTFSLLIVPGSIVVFGASWLYAINPTLNPNKNGSHASNPEYRPWISLPYLRKFYLVIYGIAQLAILAMIAAMSISSLSSGSAAVGQKNSTFPAVTSPFEKTLAFVRWNGAHPERIPQVMKYEPFFHTVHISMPDETAPEQGLNRTSLTEDGATITFTIYRQVAYTMKVILDAHPDITGLFYYHFDSWIDPLAWSDMNLEKLYFPFLTDKTKSPFTICMNDTAKQDWWGWEKDVHKKALAAASAAKSSAPNYTIDDSEWCLGWSDIYYIPRRFFEDFIHLSEVFSNPQFEVFHEVAIPTIAHIIDNSLRENPHTSVINHISDCWGDCCSSNPSVDDVLRYPCGHRLDYLNEPVTEAFFAKLASEASLLRKHL